MKSIIPMACLSFALLCASAKADAICLQNVPISDHFFKTGIDSPLFAKASRYVVLADKSGESKVVVIAWSEPLQNMVTGETVSLDRKGRFAPHGMRWEFTLTRSGCLSWREKK